MKCPGCQAQLEPSAAQQQCCPYCNASLVVELRAAERAAVAKQLLVDSDGDGIPDALQPFVDATARDAGPSSSQRAPSSPSVRSTPDESAAAKSTPARSKRGVLVFLVILTLVGGGFYLRYSYVAGHSIWRTGTCAVDADGDGVDDVVGLTQRDTKSTSEAMAVTIVSGRDGKVLHRLGSYKDGKVICLDADWFLVAPEKSFELHIYRVRSPAVPVRVKLSDAADYFGLGRGCVSVKSRDGKVRGISLANGTVTDCAAKLRYRHHEAAEILMRPDHGAVSTRGPLTAALTARPRGTPVLSLALEAGGKTRWKKELAYRKDSFGVAVALTNDRVFIWGIPVDAPKHGALVAFDAADGRELFHKTASSYGSKDVRFFRYNGKYIVATHSRGLYAYDPKDGAIAWRITP